MRYTDHNLTGASARLVDILVTTPVTRWAINLFAEMRTAVAMGEMSAEEQLDYFRDSITDGEALKRNGINEESVDWVGLFEFSDSFFSSNPESLKEDVRLAQFHNQQMLQGFAPRPLRDVVSEEEFEEYFDKLRSNEYGRAFRRYKIDRMLAFVDWLDRNRGPLPTLPAELSRSIKSLAGVKSGEYLANLWTKTLPLRYPSGIPWRQS